jgi:hypothetical protein
MLCYHSLLADRYLHILRFRQLKGPAVGNVVSFAGHDVGVREIINFSFLFFRTMLIVLNAQRLKWMPLFLSCSFLLQTSTF